MRTLKLRTFHFLNESSFGGWVIGVLIAVSLLTFTLSTEYPDATGLSHILRFVAIAFALEYILRLWSADAHSDQPVRARLDYATSFFGIVDLLAFLPALLIPFASGGTTLRTLRLLRLIRILKLRGLSAALLRVFGALGDSRAELTVSVALSLGLIFFGAVAMFIVEGPVQPEEFGSVPRSLWWSMATLTTVGYGDVYPITAMGKVVASFMAVVGIAAVAMPAGILASAFVREQVEDLEDDVETLVGELDATLKGESG